MTRAAAWALLGCILLSCGGAGPEQQLESARAHLASGEYADAADAAERGLQAGAEGAVAWRLQLAALEGEARAGQTEEALARLDRLAQEWPDQATGALYVQTAGQVREAGDAAGAVDVLDAGSQRFPEDADIARAIDRAKEAGSDAELERLRSLGYVE